MYMYILGKLSYPSMLGLPGSMTHMYYQYYITFSITDTLHHSSWYVIYYSKVSRYQRQQLLSVFKVHFFYWAIIIVLHYWYSRRLARCNKRVEARSNYDITENIMNRGKFFWYLIRNKDYVWIWANDIVIHLKAIETNMLFRDSSL